MALHEYEADMERCSQCSYCRWIPFDQIKSWRFAKGCPSVAYNNFQSYSARGRYAVGLSLLRGQSEYSDRVKDIVFKCQTCGSCDVSCKVCRYNLEPLEMIRDLKAKLVEDGQTLPQHMAVINHLKKDRNTMMQPAAERDKWVGNLAIKRLPEEKASVLFHAGCRYSYDEGLWGTVRTAVNLLLNAGVDIGIMGNAESCCGGKAYNMGYRQEFLKLAESNIKAWTRAGIKTIVTPCADCYHTFKRLYPGLGAGFQVFHIVEYLDTLIREHKIKFTREVPLTVTYHDPCHLGRQGEPYIPWAGREKKIFNQVIVYEPKKPRYNGSQGIYDPPRNILNSIPGVKLVEMERIREYAWCCGAGGGVREGYPDYSIWTAGERVAEAKQTNAEAIVTACPWCERNFLDAQENQKEKMEVLDIVDLVQRAI